MAKQLSEAERRWRKLLAARLSKRDLDSALRRLLGKDTSIEEKVTRKDLAEAKLWIVRESKAWKLHQQAHKDAKLKIIDPVEPHPEIVQENLGVESVEYEQADAVIKSYSPDETLLGDSVYGPGHAASGHAGGEYLSAGVDPNRIESSIGCPCGMMFEVEAGSDPNQSPTVTSYNAGTSSSTSSYDVSGQSSASYGGQQSSTATYSNQNVTASYN